MTQIASHEWASRVIQPRWRADYQAAAKYELFEDPISLTPAELLRVIQRYDRHKNRWARTIRRKSGSGKNAWLTVRDYAH